MNKLNFVALFLFVVSAFSVDVVVNDPVNAIDSQYIIIFHERASHQQRALHMKNLAMNFTDSDRLIATYSIGSFRGYAAKLNPTLLESIKDSPIIEMIEQDSKISIAQSCSVQSGATWGIDRISERDILLDGDYHYGVEGSGVDAYVIDTGIYLAHSGFGGRAIWGANYVDNENTDCNGHGTHVAGTIGSTVYGVAKKATLIAVKVLDCDGSGTNSGVISGIDFVVKSRNSRKRPSVANMSLGGSKNTGVNNAVIAAIKEGITFAIAAGNEDADACNSSPASVSTAITVGATGTEDDKGYQIDNRAYFSNYGKCVHVFAPGSDITSTWIGGPSKIMTISGTSMAAPHVAGIVALYLQAHPTATPESIKSAMLSNASKNIIIMDCAGGDTNCNLSPNVFVFSPCNP